MKEKTVQKTSATVVAEDGNTGVYYVTVQNVTVTADIVFVNKVPFFVTISRHIKCSTSEFLENQKTATIVNGIKHVHQRYAKQGFQITVLLMDGQFNKDNLDGEIAGFGITVKGVAADEHLPKIEQHIQTIKEHAWSVINMLPFERYPAQMIIELINYCGFWSNSFPASGGISDTLSPRATVLGSTIDYTTHCKLEFGT